MVVRAEDGSDIEVDGEVHGDNLLALNARDLVEDDERGDVDLCCRFFDDHFEEEMGLRGSTTNGGTRISPPGFETGTQTLVVRQFSTQRRLDLPSTLSCFGEWGSGTC